MSVILKAIKTVNSRLLRFKLQMKWDSFSKLMYLLLFCVWFKLDNVGLFYPAFESLLIDLLKNRSILQFYGSYRFSLVAYKNYCLHVSLTYDQFHAPLDGNHCIISMKHFLFLVLSICLPNCFQCKWTYN